MALLPGFQKRVSQVVYSGYPGDLASAKTQVQLNATGAFALGDVIVGNACFYANGGNQVCSSSLTIGATQVVAGFVLRNMGLAPMGWNDSAIGYSMVVPDGKQPTVAQGGDFLGIITGVSTLGVADHVPTLGESIYVSLADGSLASAILGTVVTGYVPTNWKITFTNLTTVATIGVNQKFAKFSGQL
jgi:hypothetical protein